MQSSWDGRFRILVRGTTIEATGQIYHSSAGGWGSRLNPSRNLSNDENWLLSEQPAKVWLIDHQPALSLDGTIYKIWPPMNGEGTVIMIRGAGEPAF